MAPIPTPVMPTRRQMQQQQHRHHHRHAHHALHACRLLGRAGEGGLHVAAVTQSDAKFMG